MADAPPDMPIDDALEPPDAQPLDDPSNSKDILPPGTVINDRFEVIEVAGKGAYGVVYRARDLDVFKREVAVKVMLPRHARNQMLRTTYLDRFKREARILADLKDTLTIFSYGQVEIGKVQCPFIAMTWLEGRTLDDELCACERMDPRRVCDLVLTALRTLEQAHQRGVIHRDIKPANLFVRAASQEGGSNDEVLYVLDYGLAKQTRPAMDGDGLSQQSGTETPIGTTTPGTLAYCAPEGFNPGSALTAARDVYSMGLVLAEMVSGQPVLPLKRLAKLDRMRFNANIMLIHCRGLLDQNEIPLLTPALLERAGGLGDVIVKATQLRPDDRYPSAAEMRKAIQDVHDDLLRAYYVNQSHDAIPTVSPSSPQKASDDAEVKAFLRGLDAFKLSAAPLAMWEELAGEALDLGRADALLAALDTILDDPDRRRRDPDLCIELARTAAAWCEHVALLDDAAAALHERLLLLDPNDDEALRWLRDHLAPAPLRDLLQRVVQQAPDERVPIALVELMAAAYVDEQPEVALVLYRQMLEQSPHRDDLFEALAALMERLERWTDLVALYDRRRRKLTTPSPRSFELALAAARIVERHTGAPPAEAIARWEALLHQDPQHLTALKALARLHEAHSPEALALTALSRYAAALPPGSRRRNTMARLGDLHCRHHPPDRIPSTSPPSPLPSEEDLSDLDVEGPDLNSDLPDASPLPPPVPPRGAGLPSRQGAPPSPSTRPWAIISPLPDPANPHLEGLRALLHGPASDEAWGQLCRALDAIKDPSLLQIALDFSRDALGLRRGDWQRPAQLVPAAWLGAQASGEIEPRLCLLEALGIERAGFALIPAGRFLMGSPEEEVGRYDWERQHEVVLSRDFAVGVFPVTQGLWTQVIGTNPSLFQGGEPAQAVLRPVEQVSWFEAVAFCNVMSTRWGLEPFYRRSDGQPYGPEEARAEIIPEIKGWEGSGWRLPTEAEWEYACRAGTKEATYAGDLEILGVSNSPLLDEIGWYLGNSVEEYEGGWDLLGWVKRQFKAAKSRTHPVGLKRANGFGLHDMLGNVYEWCWDWICDYPSGTEANPSVDPEGPIDDQFRAVRGGSWYSRARWVRAAARRSNASGRCYDEVGLRVVRSSPWRLEP